MARRGIGFCKAHALGNDFLILEEEELAGRQPAALSARMCDRHAGIGADGIVVLGAASAGGAKFRIFNSDGSEAGLSGNALRCAGAWLLARREAAQEPRPGERLVLETRVGPRALEFAGRADADWMFRAEMGRPEFSAAGIPFAPPSPVAEPVVRFGLPAQRGAVECTILSMGNPQCITFVENWEAADWLALGAELERHACFPDRANIGFVRVVSEGEVEARFWERGAGHTLASGTGSCACVVAAHLNGRTGRRVRVRVERGEMSVEWREDGMVMLEGPATLVARGTFLL